MLRYKVIDHFLVRQIVNANPHIINIYLLLSSISFSLSIPLNKVSTIQSEPLLSLRYNDDIVIYIQTNRL